MRISKSDSGSKLKACRIQVRAVSPKRRAKRSFAVRADSRLVFLMHPQLSLTRNRGTLPHKRENSLINSKKRYLHRGPLRAGVAAPHPGSKKNNFHSSAPPSPFRGISCGEYAHQKRIQYTKSKSIPKHEKEKDRPFHPQPSVEVCSQGKALLG